MTIEYDDNGKPVRIDTIVVSTQHDEFILPADNTKEAQLKADEEMLAQIRKDVIEVLMPRVIASIHNPEVLKLFNEQITYHVNPTGKFVIGGPHGDTGPSLELSCRLEAGGCAVRASPVRLGSLAQPQRRGTSP